MKRSKENTITNAVAPLLREKLNGSGYSIAAHTNIFDESTKEVDIVVQRNGYETIVVETKIHGSTQTAGANQLRNEYFGRQLNKNWRGASITLQTGMAIRYPEEASTCSQAELTAVLSKSSKFEYCLITADGIGDFPKGGFVRGSLDDIATALTIGAVPAEKIQAAINVMTAGMDISVHNITQAIAREAERFNESPIAQNMGVILDEHITEKTLIEVCSKASLFIMNAFIFQSDLAGKKDFEIVRTLNDYDTIRMSYKKVSADWIRILNVNYVPIFKPAARIIRMLHKYNSTLCRSVLKTLWRTARKIVKNHREAMHQIVGEVFQEVLADRRYNKANYTLPESASLLSALVCPDIDVNNLPKVADFACGTGALLNGVYQQVRRLYSQKTGQNDREIHRVMLEENLAGVDIYPHATHVTFTVMASAHPQVTLGSTRVLPAPFGKKEEGVYLLGSLELLDNQMLFGGNGEETVRLQGKEFGEGIVEKKVTLKREFPDKEMDIVIMNPPFLRDSADNNCNKPKSLFESEDRSESDKKEMQKALAKKETEISNGKLTYSYFVELAHNKLRDGGCMGMILPATVLTSDPFKKVREMWATKYHDVVVVTIAQKGALDSAFSSDTGMAECMVVATKGVGENTGRAKFVSLSERPNSLLAGQTLASLIQRHTVTRRVEDEAQGGERLMIGDKCMAQMLECPINAGEWGASRVKSMSLMQIAYQLRQGTLRLPERAEAINIPICPIGEIGLGGCHPTRVKDKKIGAFEMHRSDYTMQEGTDALWELKHITPQRSMQVLPDYKARVKPTHVEKARRILREHNSHTHYHQFLQFNANSVLAHWTETPSIGANLMTNIKLDKRYNAAWTLWTNSTFGMFCHWTTAGKQQAERGIITSKKQLANVPTLDVRQLSDAQLKAADTIFAELKKARLKPYNECASDAWRHILDARLLAEVLSITDVETHHAMQRLREMLSEEPSIAGKKKTSCCYKKDKKDAESRNVPYNYDDKAEASALQREQRTLKMQGIWLPE